MDSHEEIYLDHAGTAPLDPRVLAAMQPYLTTEFGNPGSFHTTGRKAKEAVDDARDLIAKILHCKAEEIVFTAGGTEANNLAILGITRAYRGKWQMANSTSSGYDLITDTVEHHSVLHPIEHLVKKEGATATFIGVDRFGLVDPQKVFDAITEQTVLISVMYANNEIGTIEPVAEIAKKIQEWKAAHGRQPNELPYFHVDACQAAGALSLDVKAIGCDLMSMNAAKVYGPKGVGFLYIRSGIRPEPIMFGGSGQEWGLRPGTENVPAIVGLAAALKIAEDEKEKENARLIALRDKLIAGILKIPKTRLNGHPTQRLPNNANISILDIEGEAMILYLDEAMIRASTGSACTSSSLDPSHVIIATGLPYEAAHGSLRCTLGRGTRECDVDRLLEVLPPIVEILRKLSPVKLNMKHYV
jgi:cysteine desulfurase